MSDTERDTFKAQKRMSDKVKADIAEHPNDYIMLTGDRPTGRLHIGHYFGTLKERVRLQDEGIHTNIVIADYQVITDRDTTEHIHDNVLNLVIDYIACGIDPERTMIFTHSSVPALNQLMLPFLSLVSESELLRNPTVKAEKEASGHALTGLLLTYPVHQACDILFCKGNVVPVGKDQLPHIEQTRQIARRFNDRYGKVFPEPVGLLTDAVEIPGLDGRKMSKSYGNAISLSATDEETAKLIKKSKTDSERFITFDPDNRTEENLPVETQKLSIGLYGQHADFYALRGAVERLLKHLGIPTEIEAVGEPYHHPGRRATLKQGDQVVCVLGEVHPDVRDRFDMPSRAYIAELDMTVLAELRTPMGAVKPMPRYPAVTRDLSLVMDESVQVGPLLADMAKAAGNILEDAKMFDVYRSSLLGPNKKSIAFSFVFRGADRTLTDAEITKAVDKLQKVAAEKYNAVIRG